MGIAGCLPGSGTVLY